MVNLYLMLSYTGSILGEKKNVKLGAYSDIKETLILISHMTK